jgi:hypothetical protein
MNSATASLSLSSFSTNENKALLWSVLHGSGKFVGIPDSQQQTIQEVFDSTIREMSEHYRKSNQSVNLNAINKEAVVVICNKIETVKQRQQQQPPYNNQHIPQQVYQKKQQQVPQLETIYRAEDLHKERQNAFQNEFKKKEEEMSSILKLKKPEEINFTDDVYDKPIGNDMERLLAEALASRERELEQIKNTAFTAPNPDSKGLGPSPTNQEFITYKTVVREQERDREKNAKENEKRVSFGSELHIIENHENNQNDYEMGENSNETSNENIGENVDENSDISFIFNKLKKIKTRKNEKYENENEYVSSINNNNNYNNNVDENNNTHTIFKMSQDIDKMSEDIKYIKNTLAELADKINKLCDHEK